MKRLRAAAALICGVLCVAGLVFGVVFAYATRTLFDASRFSQRAADSLNEPAVARVVASEVTNQIVADHRDLLAYRPVIQGTVEYVVSSAPFRAVVRRAVKTGHQTLISQAGESLSLTVSDVSVIVRNALATYPQLAERLPKRAQLVLGSTAEWPNGKLLIRVIRTSHRFRVHAMTWMGVGLVAGVCGVWLARRRDRYLLRVGLGLAITALVIGAVARFGGEIFALLTRSLIGRDLIRGLWPTFVGPLALPMAIIAGIGLVLVAGVTSLIQKVDLSASARAVWSVLGYRPRHNHWGFGRAVLLVVIGLAIAVFPSLTLRLVTILAGGLLFFFGVQELFALAIRAVPEARDTATAVAERRGSRWPGVAIVATLVLLLAVAGTYWLVRDDEQTAMTSTTIDACNGYAELCDRRVNEVCFATTHNSMASSDIETWMFPNQEAGIRAQLEDGVRGFLIDIHVGMPIGDRVKTMIDDEGASMQKYEEVLGKEGVDAAMRIRNRMVGEESGERDIYLCHGFCELGATRFTEALETMRDFLVENPNEVLIIVIQDEGVSSADVAACFEKSGLDEFVYRGPVTSPWPTLRSLVATDQRVLVFAENKAEGVEWYHLVWDAFQETPYRFKDPAEFSNGPNRGSATGSLLLMNNWIETTPPKPSNAAIVNAYDSLLKRARACRRERGMMPNLVAVDFYATGDLIRVVDTMNGVAEPAAAAAP
jgi:hypothetical protein